MLKIGLTGGICSGKSTVVKFFENYNIKIIDADLIAHEIIKSNQSVFKKIVEHYGKQVLDSQSQQLNRKKLRNIIFTNSNERHWLENLLHPLIRTMIKQKVSQIDAPYCILVIPLLVESKSYDLVDRVLVIDCSIEKQLQRAIVRDNLTITQIQQIIATQVKREERLAIADDIIDNNNALEALSKQVEKLHKKYSFLRTT
jgi:dephospho-CoA kinase